MRTDRLRLEYGVNLIMRAFPLHPEIPEAGMELSELFAGREALITSMQTRLQQVAAVEKLPLTNRSRTYNSRRAQELGKWAEAEGAGDAFHHAVYRAYFVDGVNISLIDALATIVDSIGLSAVKARDVISSGQYAAAVDIDWQLASEKRITAVPTHLHGEKRLAGFAPYEDFVRLIS